MIIQCPQCNARYNLKDGAIGPGGRKMRCGSCAHVWHCVPADGIFEEEPEEPDVEAETGPESGSEPEPASQSSIDDMFAATAPKPEEKPEENPEENPEPEPEETREDVEPIPDSIRPFHEHLDPDIDSAGHEGEGGADAQGRSQRLAPMLGSIAAGTVAAGAVFSLVCAGLWFGRAEVARVWPASVALYAMLGAGIDVPASELAFKQIATRFVPGGEGIGRRLEIEGRLVNGGRKRVEIPPLLLTVTDAGDHPLVRWIEEPPSEEIDPGKSLIFTASASVPRTARQVSVTFLMPWQALTVE